jgi:hypothetical protein
VRVNGRGATASALVWVQVSRASVRALSSKLCTQLSISDEEGVRIVVQSLNFASHEDFLIRDRKGLVLYFLIWDRWSDAVRA